VATGLPGKASLPDRSGAAWFNQAKGPSPMTTTTLSPREAALRLGVSPETIRALCRTGRLGRRLLGRYKVAVAEVEALEAGARVPSPIAKAAAYALDRHPTP
jgi:hypothetical protein